MNLIATALTLLVIGGDPGSAVFPLLKIGQGVRASAMGESFTGLADDASAVYWNPGGLGLVSGTRFALSHQEWFEGIRDEIGHASLPLGPGALGLGLVYTGEPNVRYWNREQQRFEDVNVWGGMFSLGYGLRLADRFGVGATFTGLYQDLKLETGRGGMVALGFTGRPTDWLSFGLSGRHMGTMSYGGESQKIPTEVALGAALNTGMLKITVDGAYPTQDNPLNIRAGAEFSPIRALALRVGYRSGPVNIRELGYFSGLTAGLGVTLGNFGLDYAFVPYGELGYTHRVGLRLDVPPPSTGWMSLVVLDAETRKPLVANLAVTGVYDTTARTDELVITRAWPGEGTVKVTLDEYESKNVPVTVTAGRKWQDTVMLKKLTVVIKGGIYDARTQEPIGGTLSYSGPKADKLTLPTTPGTYELKSMPAGEYSMRALGPTADYLEQEVTLNIAPGKTVEQNFYLWKKGDLISLQVNFETGKDEILPEFYPLLDLAGQILKQTPQIKKIELSGHTDPRKIVTPEFVAKFKDNWGLSLARAEAIKRYLVEKWGIAPERIVTKGYADSRPIASNATEEGMYKNRRTELRILE